MESQLTANIDYTVIDRAPLSLRSGQKVRLGKPDKSWPGWIWVSDEAGHGSYVPAEVIKKHKDGSGTVTQAFEARDLSVKKGESVTLIREVQGWLWCRNAQGEEGWLPEYLLR